MSTLTITLSEDRLAKLQEIANRFNIKAEELTRVSIEELLTRPEESFQQAAEKRRALSPARALTFSPADPPMGSRARIRHSAPPPHRRSLP